MLAELLLAAVTPASRALRRMGLVKASVGLWSRSGRQSRPWAPHYQRCHAVVERALSGLPRCRTVVVLGSGLVRDVPIRRLLDTFSHVLLVDAVHLPIVRARFAFQSRVAFRTADLSGLSGWLDGTARGRVAPDASLFRGDDVDLVISANLLSQIPLGVATFLDGHPDRAAELPDDMLARSVRGHLADLAGSAARVCLLTDVAMEERDTTGKVTDRLDLMRGVALPRPDECWDWTVAPMGEIGREHEYVHRVHAYADLGRSLREAARG
jgi:hypothetical protein